MSIHSEHDATTHDLRDAGQDDRSDDVAEYQQWQHAQIDINTLLTRHFDRHDELSPLELALQDREPEFFARNCIPADKSLWKLERYDDFIAARQTLINERFKDVLRYLDEAEQGVRFD
jgi:hypothetical protein